MSGKGERNMSHIKQEGSASGTAEFREETPVKNKRGESNKLRKGRSKIHRRYTPKLCCAVPRGTASKVVARVQNHDWHRNLDLIALRRKGYVPYTKRNNPNFVPKPMRIRAREEIRETLTVLSMAMAAHCDYNPDSDYCFEIMMPFEQIAAAAGMLHVYDNGRKAYDSPREALSVMEQMGYVIVDHDKDPDAGQNKPMRIWLADKFFTSRGIAGEEIREWLGKFKLWALKKGLTESLRKKYEHHLLRLEAFGLDLKRKHSLRNRLKQIKRWVVSPDLDELKQTVMATLEGELDTLVNKDNSRIDRLLDDKDIQLRALNRKRKQQHPYYRAWVQWSNSVMPHEAMTLEALFRHAHPGLVSSDPEMYYRLLLELANKR